MTRFEREAHPLVLVGIFLTVGVVFWVDLMTVLGIAVWIFYLVPVAFSLWVRRASLPLRIAAVSTLLIAAGRFLSPESTAFSPAIATVNRAFGVATVWILAFITRNYILARMAVLERDWVREGQHVLSSRTQGELTTDDLAAKALSFLAEYTGAAIGALYVAGHEGAFRLAGRHATDPALPPPATIGPGDGVAGQAIKERRPVFLEEVPTDALPVRTSFGRATPRQLAVIPLMADGAVTGALELGFLRQMGHSERDLLSGVAELLGVAVRSALYRARLQELLAETQHQQEELRVANEELEEQATALRDSQARLESQQAELEQSNAQLEEQANALERQRDDLARSQEETRATAANLARASQYKSEFLANMSHELRTPLNSSLILAKLLADNKEGNLTPEQVEYARTILGAGNDLLALVNDVLDLSKIEAGHLQLRIEPVAIGRVVESLARSFRPLADDKQLAFDTRVDPGVPERMGTDPQRLEQILKNLLSNAIKFTERGQVTLAVSSPGPEQIRFEVRDTGIGISPEHLEAIFDAFRQADGSTHRKYGGTGLGLSISRDLARKLGGDVRVTSTLGQGSTFTVDLPRVAGEHLGETAALTIEPRQLRRTDAQAGRSEAATPALADDRDTLTAGERSILVVEDDLRFASLLMELARQHEFRCLVATTAAEGIVLAQRFRPSAVVLDVNLPEESGLTVLERLKRDPAMRHIPVHVVSVVDYTQQALEMGAIGYALKPVKHDELVAAFRKLERRMEQTLNRVLLVEDSPVQRETLTALLGGDDVEIVEAASAEAALEQLRASTFDCMVLDLGLPGMSGFELLDRMAESATYSFPPVIVYTGRSVTPEEELRLRRYSRSIVIKGARSPERLLDEVTLFLHRVESKLPPDRRKQLREARRREEAFEGRRILLVEDDVRSIFALASILEPRGAKLVVARNGKEALAELEKGLDGRPAVDLVLMDLMMPEMDGLTATREIRKRLPLKDLPIIALTAKAMPEDRQQCLEAGANDYISKPIDVERLVSLVRVWMRR